MYVEMFFPVSCLGPQREHTDCMTFILYSDSVVVTVRGWRLEDFLVKVTDPVGIGGSFPLDKVARARN
jgi:hypothetical protein